jgi:hypothetical protein
VPAFRLLDGEDRALLFRHFALIHGRDFHNLCGRYAMFYSDGQHVGATQTIA